MMPVAPYVKPEDIDLQLDLINHMWDRMPYYDYMFGKSAECRKLYRCMENIRVGPREEERIDVFPADQPNAPIFIFVHGGWWRGGTRKHYSYVANGWVKRGYTVIISDYTLCPKVGVPDITQASRAAVVWAYENADKINGNKDRIFLSGHSAGGQQAGMMAVTNWEEHGVPADVLKGVVPISGMFDMRVFETSWLQPWLQLTGNSALGESALFQIPDNGPPLLVMLGEEESQEFHRQSEIFTAAWRAKRLRAEYLAVEGEDHSTTIQQLGDPESRPCKAIAAFFESC